MFDQHTHPNGCIGSTFALVVWARLNVGNPISSRPASYREAISAARQWADDLGTVQNLYIGKGQPARLLKIGTFCTVCGESWLDGERHYIRCKRSDDCRSPACWSPEKRDREDRVAAAIVAAYRR